MASSADTQPPVQDILTATIKDERNGFLSSILSAAHNAAHIIESISKDDKRTEKQETPRRNAGLDSKLDSLLQGGGEFSNVSSNSSTRSPVVARLGSHAMEDVPTLDPSAKLLQPVSLASNVHFELIRESPVTTMGTGNLLLLHFDKKKATKLAPLTDNVSRLSVNGGVVSNDSVATDGGSNRLSVTDGHEGKVVRRKSVSNGSVDEEKPKEKEADEMVTNADDNSSSGTSELSSNQELDQILDSATVSKASKKKNRDFHHAFRKIPPSEPLISDFSCALSKDILVHGKMYLSQHHICFNSNILGWVTNITIPLQEVIQIEKKSTAVLFPNGMIIRTLHQKYVFATFLSRDATFNLITKVWHDALQENSSDEPGRRRGWTRSRAKIMADPDITSGRGTDSSEGDLMLDVTGTASNASTDERPDGFSRKLSTKTAKSSKPNISEEDSVDGLGLSDSDIMSNSKGETNRSSNPSDKERESFNGFKNPGPKSHAPTKSNYSRDANDVDITEVTFKAPLGVVYELLFGSDNSTFVKILENQKNFDILSSKIVGISNNKKERDYSYIKPLGGSIGPKQTKCLITDTLKFCDFSKYVEVEEVTQTPDVPSGNSFKVRTRLFFTWGPDNTTKLFVVTSIEWSAKSWIKSAIEKGSIDGQKESMKILVDTLNETISNGGSSSSPKKKRKKSKSVSTPPPQPKVEPKPLTLTEQITNLLEAIGTASPVKIPMVDASVTGVVILILLSFIHSIILLKLIGGSGSKLNLEITGDKDTFTRLVRVNDERYFLLPTSDTYLSNKKNRKLNEAKMWDWINERSNGKLKGSLIFQLQNTGYDDFVSQEFENVVKLAKQRIDQLQNHLDSN